MAGLADLTAAERASAGDRGRAALAAKIAAGRATLRQDYADMAEWERLAREAGLRLPMSWQPVTPAGMKRWLRRLGIPLRAYLAWNGAGLDGNETSARLADFARRNPDWSLRAWAGLVLEHRDLILRLEAAEARSEGRSRGEMAR
ncbi:MAG: hypothetical protein AB1609_20450 [Bacillota bacterium]